MLIVISLNDMCSTATFTFQKKKRGAEGGDVHFFWGLWLTSSQKSCDTKPHELLIRPCSVPPVSLEEATSQILQGHTAAFKPSAAMRKSFQPLSSKKKQTRPRLFYLILFALPTAQASLSAGYNWDNYTFTSWIKWSKCVCSQWNYFDSSCREQPPSKTVG